MHGVVLSDIQKMLEHIVKYTWATINIILPAKLKSITGKNPQTGSYLTCEKLVCVQSAKPYA